MTRQKWAYKSIIDSLKAYLTTILTCLCMDQLDDTMFLNAVLTISTREQDDINAGIEGGLQSYLLVVCRCQLSDGIFPSILHVQRGANVFRVDPHAIKVFAIADSDHIFAHVHEGEAFS